MKYLFITLKVQDGEHEHTHRALQSCEDYKNVLRVANDYVSTFYDLDEDEVAELRDDWYNFNVGSIAIKVENVEVLSEYEYQLLSKIFNGNVRPGYFQIVQGDYNESLEREEVQIHCGENGYLMISKTPEGFVVDIYNQDGILDTMTVWEDDLSPLEIEISLETHKKDIEMFLLNNGQKHSEITANLGLRPSHADSDEILMEDYFYLEGCKKWYPKNSSMYGNKEQAIADFLRDNRDNY